MAFLGLAVIVTFLGASSFLAGILPLTASLSKTRLSQIATMGTGLLLGAAMGVIIPEGIDAVYDATSKSGANRSTSPSLHVAFSLLAGFTVMYFIEQVVAPALFASSAKRQNYALAPSASNGGPGLDSPLSTVTAVGPDLDLDVDLEAELNALGVDTRKVEVQRDPKMVTLGLVIHSLAEGLALGAANALTLTPTEGPTDGTSVSENAAGLSFVVFLAIAVHKAPTALALSSSLVTQLPVRKIRHHLIVFSLASPISALLTYFVITFFGGAKHVEEWTGTVLMFSGGTFLYVATVLSALPDHSHGDSGMDAGGADLPRGMRAALVVGGMFLPLMLSGLVGHGH